MRNIPANIISIILLFFINELCYSQHLKPPIKNFTPKQYFGHTQNWDIAQDIRGIMYFANGGENTGLLEFDGEEWKQYYTKYERSIYSLAINSTGKIFAGCRGEFGYFSPDSTGKLSWVNLSDHVPDSLKDFSIIWKIHIIPDPQNFEDTLICFKSSNNLFLFCEYKEGIKVVSVEKSLFRSYEVNNKIWIPIRSKGIFSYTKAGLKLLPDTEIFGDELPAAILPYDSSHVLIITRKNLYLYQTASKPLSDYSRISEKLPINKDNNIVKYFFSSKNIKNTSILERLINAKIYGGIQTNTQDYLIYTSQDGAFILSKEGDMLYHLSSKNELQNDNINNAYSDNEGRIWLALNDGISLVRPYDPISLIHEGDDFTGQILDIIRHNNTLYFSTTQGVYYICNKVDCTKSSRKYNNTLTTYNPLSISKENIIKVKDIGAQCHEFAVLDNNLYVATSSGIYHIKGGESKMIYKGNYYAISPVKQINNHLLVAGGRKGIILLQKSNNRWTEILHIDNLPDEVNNIYCPNPGTNNISTFKNYDKFGTDSIYLFATCW